MFRSKFKWNHSTLIRSCYLFHINHNIWCVIFVCEMYLFLITVKNRVIFPLIFIFNPSIIISINQYRPRKTTRLCPCQYSPLESATWGLPDTGWWRPKVELLHCWTSIMFIHSHDGKENKISFEGKGYWTIRTNCYSKGKIKRTN